MSLKVFLALGILALPQPGLAQDVEITKLSAQLPAPVLKRIRAAPDRFLAEAAAVIYGSGGSEGVTRDGIADHIALRRAGLRAKEMRRLLAADLDNDGAIAAEELDVVVAAQGAETRAALLVSADAADSNGDGTISAGELRSQAETVAMKKFPLAEAESLLALTTFDLDGNGRVTVREMDQGMALLGEQG